MNLWIIFIFNINIEEKLIESEANKSPAKRNIYKKKVHFDFEPIDHANEMKTTQEQKITRNQNEITKVFFEKLEAVEGLEVKIFWNLIFLNT